MVATIDHFLKLKEMCAKHMPHFHLEFEYEGSGNKTGRYEIVIRNKNEQTGNTFKKVDWFELCYTWLAQAVLYTSDKRFAKCEHQHQEMITETMLYLSPMHEMTGIHPIDYLYSFFKTNKDAKVQQKAHSN